MDLRKIWDSRAGPWIKWARTPWHDAYWYYAAQFFDDVGPSSGDRALEIGCGEGRVIRPTGSLCICIVHPLRDAGRFKTDDEDAEFIISTSYFERRIYEETFQRDGLEMTFTSWRYPIEDYARAFEDAGLLIERVREPLPNAEAIARQPRRKRSERVPMFLFVHGLSNAPTHRIQ